MPYKEEETETVLPSRGVRGLLERPKGFGTEPQALSGTPLGFWNRASGSPWNAR